MELVTPREKLTLIEYDKCCKTLYRNWDNTYTVFVEQYNTKLTKVTHSYEMNYGLFSEAMENIKNNA